MEKSKEIPNRFVKEMILRDKAGTIKDYMSSQNKLNVYFFLKAFYSLEKAQAQSGLYHSIYNKYFIGMTVYTQKTSLFYNSNESHVIKVLSVTEQDQQEIQNKYQQFSKIADDQSKGALFSILFKIAHGFEHELSRDTKFKRLTKVDKQIPQQENSKDESSAMQIEDSETDSEHVPSCC